jgi:hypothetical protein
MQAQAQGAENRIGKQRNIRAQLRFGFPVYFERDNLDLYKE